LLHADASLFAKLRRNARAHAAEHLSVNKMNLEYQEVFRRLSPPRTSTERQQTRHRKPSPFNFGWLSDKLAE
jgi:hypothetical protein